MSSSISISEEVKDFTNNITKKKLAICGTQGQGKTTLMRKILQDKFGVVPETAVVGTTAPHQFEYSLECFFKVVFFTQEEVCNAIKVALPDDDSKEENEDYEIEKELVEDFFNDGNIEINGELPEEFANYYDQTRTEKFDSKTDLVKGLNCFYEELNRVDKLGLLLKHVTIGFPSPFLRWITLVDLPGNEDMLPHRNAFLNDQCEAADVLFLVHRRGAGAISKNQRKFFRRVCKRRGDRLLKMVVTNAMFNGTEIATDDERIKKSLPQSHRHIMDSVIHVESHEPLFLDEMTNYLRELLEETNIVNQVQSIENACERKIKNLKQIISKEVTCFKITVKALRKVIIFRINSLGRISWGADYFCRDLKYAQLQNSIVSGIATRLCVEFFNKPRYIEHPELTESIPINYNIPCDELLTLLRNYSNRYRYSPFFQYLNTLCGSGMVDRLEQYVEHQGGAHVEAICKLINDFLKQKHDEFLPKYMEQMVASFKTKTLSNETKEAINLFIEDVLSSVDLGQH